MGLVLLLLQFARLNHPSILVEPLLSRLIWNIFYLNNIIIWLRRIIATNSVSNDFAHYVALKKIAGTLVVRPSTAAVAKEPLTEDCVGEPSCVKVLVYALAVGSKTIVE